MKKNLFYLGSLVILSAFLMSATMKKQKPVTLNVNTSISKIGWLGKKVVGQHSGQISIKSGQVTLQEGKITGGMFSIDMNTITCDDLKDEYNAKLIGHLKSDDFFGPEKFPTADFKITSVKYIGKTNAQITGDLTIKGITHALTFPTDVTPGKNNVHAKATIKVDRTKYDIKYGSGSFFDNLGDKAIENEFTLTVNLHAGM